MRVRQKLKTSILPYSRIIPENDFAFLFVKVQDLVLLLITVRVHLLILGGIKSRMITKKFVLNNLNPHL